MHKVLHSNRERKKKNTTTDEWINSCVSFYAPVSYAQTVFHSKWRYLRSVINAVARCSFILCEAFNAYTRNPPSEYEWRWRKGKKVKTKCDGQSQKDDIHCHLIIIIWIDLPYLFIGSTHRNYLNSVKITKRNKDRSPYTCTANVSPISSSYYQVPINSILAGLCSMITREIDSRWTRIQSIEIGRW